MKFKPFFISVLTCFILFIIAAQFILRLSNENAKDEWVHYDIPAEENHTVVKKKRKFIHGVIRNSVLPSDCINGENNNLSWKISPKPCTNNVYLIWLIKSTIGKNSFRQSVRNSWGGDIEYIENNVKYTTKRIFIIGFDKNNNLSTTTSLEQESNTYQDILQGSFTDTEESVTKKVVLGMQFAKKHCTTAQYVVVAEDNAVLLPWNLLLLLPAKQELGDSDFFGGIYTYYIKAVRDRGNLWYVPVNDYHCEIYPPYPKGSGFFMSFPTMTRLYDEAVGYHLFKIDDVLFGGIALELGIKAKELSLNYYEEYCSTVTNANTRNVTKLKELIMCHGAERLEDQMLVWAEICRSPVSSKAVPYYLQYCKKLVN